jgi:ribonucleoside-diphosphate reductase beta chain
MAPNTTIDPALVDEGRNSIFPIKHRELWERFYKAHESTIWHVHEVSLVHDLDAWNALNDNERHFLSHVLGFFANSDLVVGQNLVSRFLSEVKILESQFFYGFQLAMENIHSEQYALLIDTYIKDPVEKERMFNAVHTLPCVGAKANWAKKWIDSDAPFGTRLVAFAIVEGLFFSGAFCSIYWLRDQKRCPPGLAVSNDFISRDEGLHTDHACFLYNNYVVNKMSQDEFGELMREAVQIELDFITSALPCSLLGINASLMSAYVKFVANRLSRQLGYEPLFSEGSGPKPSEGPTGPKPSEGPTGPKPSDGFGLKTSEAYQPFDFMNMICIPNKTNFFEGKVTEYKKSEPTVEGDPFADL